MGKFIGLLLVLSFVACDSLFAGQAPNKPLKKTGILELELSEVERHLAELKQLQEDPQRLVEKRLENLLDKSQAAKRMYEYQETARAVGQSGHPRGIIWDYYEGRVSLKRARKELLPLVREDVDNLIKSGALENARAQLERRRADLLRIKEVSETRE